MDTKEKEIHFEPFLTCPPTFELGTESNKAPAKTKQKQIVHFRFLDQIRDWLQLYKDRPSASGTVTKHE